MRRQLIPNIVLCTLAVWTVPVYCQDLDSASGSTGQAGFLEPEARDAELEGLEQQLAQLRSLQVRFLQQRDLEIFAEPVVSEGVLAFVRPDRLHWEWITPYPSVLVLNHGQIERFDVMNGGVRKIRAVGQEMLHSVAVQMTRWMQGRFRESSDLFQIEVLEGTPRTILLVTRSPELRKALLSVRIAVDEEARVSSVSLISPKGETTTMYFRDEQRNFDLDATLFDLNNPRLIGSEIDPR